MKPQGSLERSRDTVVNNTDISIVESLSTPSARKPRQNVAMQAIMRRAETEQKQVTFKNISPVITEEEESKKTKPGAQITIAGSKNSQVVSINASQNAHITVQNRPPLMPVPVQNQNAVQNQKGKSQTLQQNQIQPQSQIQSQLQNPVQLQIQPQSQIHQLQPQSQVLPSPPINQQFSPSEQRNQGISQFQLPLNCFQNQSFNVQNPTFSKNFIANQVPDLSSYQIPGQYQQGVNPNRLHQRGNLGIAQNSVMQQGLNLNSTPQNIQNLTQQNIQNLTQNIQNLAQQNIQRLTQNVGLQSATTNPNLQQTLGIQQQTNLGIHQQNMIQNDPRNNGLNMHNQLNMPVPGITNSMLNPSNLTGYQKNIQQGGPLPNIPNTSLSSSDVTNIQMGFNPNFGQNSLNQMPQKNVASAAYAKNPGQFPLPNQASLTKGQQGINSYPLFHGYESQDFNPWKEPQPPQPPFAWWGTPGQPQMMHGKESASTDAFQNWANSPSPGNMIGRVPLTPGNNYTQNPFHGRQYNARNSLEEARSFDVSSLF